MSLLNAAAQVDKLQYLLILNCFSYSPSNPSSLFSKDRFTQASKHAQNTLKIRMVSIRHPGVAEVILDRANSVSNILNASGSPLGTENL